MRVQKWMPRLLGLSAVAIALFSTGCKSLNERYLSMEVWKYEKCFGHLPPGFVPPGAMAAAAAPAAPRVCGQGGNCAQAAPCAGGEMASTGGENCSACQGGVQGGMGVQGGVIEGGLPAGTTIVPGSSTIHQGGTMLPGGAGAPILPSGPGGAPGPVPSASLPTPVSAVSTSRPVVISDEVVLP